MHSPSKTLAILFATLVSSAVINPPSSAIEPIQDVPVTSGQEIPPIHIGVDGQAPKATFNIPCVECLGTDEVFRGDDHLPFHFQAFEVDQPCGVSNISLNGRSLAQDWVGTDGYGQGIVPITLPGRFGSKLDLNLEWNSSCLYEAADESLQHPESAAQALTVFIKAVNGTPVTTPRGFTISYKQLGLPELLRLSLTPEPAAGGRECSEEWRNPPQNLRLSLPGDSAGSEGFRTLETHIQELAKLEEDAQALAQLIEEKKRIIEAESNAEQKSIKNLIEQCESLSCIFKVITGGFRSAAKTVYLKIQYFGHISGETLGWSDHHGLHSQSGHSPNEATFMNDENTDTSATKSSGSESSASKSSNCASMHVGSDGSRTGNADCPLRPTSTARAVSRPLGYGEEPEHHHYRAPTPKETLILSLEVLAGILGVAAVFTIIRRNCCSLRRKTNRRARREERRAEREYRSLARRQAWRDWWYGRDRRRIHDYEEKRALIIDQEERLEDAMQSEIRALREAHNMVQNMVNMEEGRIYSPISPDRPPSRSSSLPDYRSEVSSLPPAYDEDGGSDIVANGFRQYRPTSTAQWTPGSSVIALSPRPSSETLRRSGEDEHREQRRAEADESESESDFYSDVDLGNNDEKNQS